MLTRRQFYLASTMLLLAACKGTGTTPVVTQGKIQEYGALIGAGLADLIGALHRVPGMAVPDDVVARVTAELAIIEGDAAQIQTALTPSPSWIQAIATAISAIYPLVTPFFPAAPAIAVAMQAALAIVGGMLSMAGIQASVQLQASSMTETQAVDTLRLYSRTGIR